MVAAAATMILGQARDGGGVEPAGFGERRAVGDRRGLGRERAAEPGADRGDEAHLAAVEDLVGQPAAQRPLHQPFAAAAAQPHPRRQPRRELDQPMVEQRLARLEAHRHAGAVDLGEDVAGEPDHQVGILGARQRIARRRLVIGADVAVLGAMPLQRAAKSPP